MEDDQGDREMTMGEKIKYLRLKNKLTQTDIADYIGTNKQAVFKYENGIIKNIPLDKIEKIAFSSRWYSCAPFSEGMAMVSNGSNDFFIKLIRTEKEYFCFEYNNRYVLQI